MKLATSLVPVKKITSPVDRSNFDENALNTTAKLILQVEGIINPLIVRRINLESYEVVEGHFEYYAAVKARELEPRKGEMIGAFIIEPENETLFLEQAKYFRNRESAQAVGKIPMEPSAGVSEIITPSRNDIEEVKNQLEQLEKSFNQQLKKFHNEFEQLFNKIYEIIEPAPEKPTKKEIEQAMGSKTQAEAAWKAIKYLRSQGREINKENLKKLSKAKKAPDKIKDFANGTYEKLIQVVNITD